MAGFTSRDDLINEITVNGKHNEWDFFKVGPTAEAAGVWTSLWYAVGTPGAGADPATTPGTAYDNAAGSINFADVSADTRHLLTLGATATQNSTLMLYDRLVGVSGISVASTGNKTINSAALPRYSGTAAADVECWLELTTATTVTAVVCSLNSYTNEAGATGRAGGTVTFPAAATDVRAMIGPMPLQAGDKGVQSVEVGLNVATAASAGVVNVLLIRPLAYLPISTPVWNEREFVAEYTALPQLYDGHTLGLAYLAHVATAANFWGQIRTAHG